MDYSKMSDQEINLAVARIIHPDLNPIESKARPPSICFPDMHEWVDYCNHPANSWPIIEENGISINHYNGVWEASFEWDAPVGAFGTDETVTTSTEHKNPLRAAMVAYLMMREVANVQTDSTR